VSDIIQIGIGDLDDHQQYYAEYVLCDAEQADEWPDDELHLVTLDPGAPTVEGTPRGIRWLYDYMEWAEDAYKLEDGRAYARGCRAVADKAWSELPEDPPGRQYSKRVR